MTNRNHPISYFAETNFRPPHFTHRFGIRQADRLSHMYIIGKTGTGKSTLAETLAAQDLEAGRGFMLIDPHGDLVERVGALAKAAGRRDIVDFDLTDRDLTLGYNPLRLVHPDLRPLAASGMLEVLQKLWGRYFGPRMEHILRNTLLALLDQPEATLADVPRMLGDKAYRAQAVANVANSQVREFWLNEFANYSPRLRSEAIVPIQNKIGAFLSHPSVCRAVGKPKRTIHFRRIMDEGQVLLVNLAKGRLGSDPANLLGALLVTTAGLAAVSRANQPEHARRDFFIYVDEFQSFTTLSFANMLAELRKYHVGLILANQYLHQLDEDVRDAVLGNAGTIVAFRVGANDATFLAREFQPELTSFDFLTLPNHHVYLKLMIDGAPSLPFSARTLTPDQLQHLARRQDASDC